MISFFHLLQAGTISRSLGKGFIAAKNAGWLDDILSSPVFWIIVAIVVVCVFVSKNKDGDGSGK